MFPPRPTQLLHTLLESQLKNGDITIDATAGNGHDTLFLARTVGPNGRVIALDIQEHAIKSTEIRLRDAGVLDCVDLRVISHSKIKDFASTNSVSCIIFNLGYLPGADHGVITTESETLKALSGSIQILKTGGALAVICYPGHLGGDTEAIAVKSFIEEQSNLRTACFEMIGTKAPSPFLLISRKMA